MITCVIIVNIIINLNHRRLEWATNKNEQALRSTTFSSSPEDLCRPNPCGRNAECTPGYDKEGNDRPVCTCPRGYVGNPLHGCTRGECQVPEDCRDHETCYVYKCQVRECVEGQ